MALANFTLLNCMVFLGVRDYDNAKSRIYSKVFPMRDKTCRMDMD